ncbi:MAG: hypothetical protein HGB12_14900 [Bacteroidetes bacterium]|nr:hypothetical protein [Bacteroidota bacterium]
MKKIYKTVKMIDMSDWDKLVSDTYKKPYCFQQQDGCKPRGIHTIIIPEEFYEKEKYEEEMNDSVPEVINNEEEMGVKFKVWLDRDPDAPLNPSDEELKKCPYYWGKSEQDEKEWKKDKSNINFFWIRNFYPNIQAVANDLYKKGLIEAGEYIINIDW